MIRKLKKSTLVNYVTYVLILNFINLTANFYQEAGSNKYGIGIVDPIDTLAEIIVEFIFEMDDQIIPDTDVPNETRKIPDIKLAFTKTEVKLICFASIKLNKWEIYEDFTLSNGIKKVCSPPPENLKNYFI